MANLPSLERLKRTYRARYRGNPSGDLPDLGPRENAVAFIDNYLKLRESNSDSEDSVTIELSRRARVSVRSRIQQSKEKEAQDSPAKSHVNNTPRYSQGNGHLTMNRDLPTIPNFLKKNGKQSEISENLFSDEESDNEKTYMVAKLIEESLPEGEDIVDDKVGKNSEEPAKQLYSSNTSVLQQPPSPTSNIHAKKWLRFNDSALAADDGGFTRTLSRTSGKFTNHAKQFNLQNAVHSNKKPDSADLTYDLHTETIGPNDEFVIEEESGGNVQAWINPFKKKKDPPLSTRPKEDKPRATPKKTNSLEAASSLKRKSENVKSSLNSNDTPKRVEDVFLTEGESSSAWTSLPKKRVSLLSTRSKDDKLRTTPTKTNSLEAPSSLKNKLEKVKESPPANSAPSGSRYILEDGRLEDEFVIEEESNSEWMSPFKMKKASPLSTRSKEDKPTATPSKRNNSSAKTNSLEAPSSLKNKLEKVKESPPANSAPSGRLEDEFVIEEESNSEWMSPFKMKKASPLSTRSKEDKPTATPSKRNNSSAKTNSLEAPSSLKNKFEKVKESRPANSAPSGRLEDEFVIEEESNSEWMSPFKMKKASPLSTRSKEDKPTATPKKTISLEAPSSLKKKSENVKSSLNSNATAERVVNAEKTNDQKTRKRSLSSVFFKIAAAGVLGDRKIGSPAVSKAPNTLPAAAITEEEFEIEDVSDMNKSNLLINPVKKKSIQTGHVGKREKSALHDDDENFESEPTVIKLNRTQDLASFKIDNTAVAQIHFARDVNLESSNASTPSDTEADACVPQEPALLRVVEGTEQLRPLSQNAASQPVAEGIEKQVASSQDANLTRDIEGIESVNQDVLPVENQEDYCDHIENGLLNPTKQVQQMQTIRSSPRRKSDWIIADDLEETFNIRIRKGKAAAKKTRSKPAEEKQEEHLVKRKKTQKNVARKKSERQKSNKQRKSSKPRNEVEPAEACMSGEILEKCASREEGMKENIEATLGGQFHNGNLEIDNCEEEQTGTDVYLPKKRKSKMKNINTPCPADHSNEDSVFQSGPVTRQKAISFAEPVEPLAINLDYLEKHEELLKRYLIVFDPDTKSDALLECIAQSDSSKFVGNDCCSYWNSFNNGIFTTGRLRIAPKRKSEACNYFYEIKIYYVEQGVVQVNIYKSERILKKGDFFFVPPGNLCTMTNLQDEEALLVYSYLKIPTCTEG
ncbi:centromere protein C isoform X3 [Eleutherodactylus coqui]|uniref:centromere protein C isoform X3 n=1 Tax=Eleutherodactylus coqui TaxID=57060 RepID=UPI0034634547